MKKTVKLGTMGDIFIGLTYHPDDVSSEGTIVLRSSNIQDGRLDFSDVVRVKCSIRDNLFVKQNDILMCSRNGSAKLVGKCALLPRSDEKMTFGAFMTIIRTEHNEYLLHFFNSNAFRNQLGSAATTTINQITRKMLDDICVPVYDNEKEHHITSKFNKIDDLIYKKQQQLSELDELVKSRFIELFGATSTENCTKQIKDYAEVLGGYAFKSDLFCADAIPVIRISNINNGCVELDYNICFDELFWERNKRFRVEQNDVLMAMSGATTGKAGIYRENMPALINQRVACIRAKDGVACPTFLFVATQLEWMYDLIQETSAGCAQPNISGKQIENMPVPDASYEKQQQFACFVEQTDKSKFEIQKSLEKLETLKKALMQKYFG